MKLKINGFKKITAKPVVETFTKYTLDDSYMDLTVREDSTGKYFVIETTFQVYGWTTDAHKAFSFFNNIVPIYNTHEIYEIARGRKV